MKSTDYDLDILGVAVVVRGAHGDRKTRVVLSSEAVLCAVKVWQDEPLAGFAYTTDSFGNSAITVRRECFSSDIGSIGELDRVMPEEFKAMCAIAWAFVLHVTEVEKEKETDGQV